MSDISITKFRVQIPRNGSIPSTPGFAQSEGQDPVNPPGSPTGIYVPYLGATGSVDLGEFGLATGYVKFDTTPTNIPTDQGTMYWDEDDETVALIMNGAIQKVGEDSFYPVKNQTGSNIAKGVAVRFAGTVGNSGRLLIEPFLADGTYPSSYFMGVTMEAIDNGENGKVMWFGRVRGINTNAYNEGDILYASTTVAGGFQTAVPQAPNNIVQIAAVVTKSATVGTIFIRPTLGSNINKDEGVKITSGTTGDLLQLQSNGLWENRSLATVIGTAYVPSTRTLTINGTAFDLSANRSWSVGTVTSVGLTVPTGLTVANSPVTGSGTLAISLQSGYSIPTTAKQTEWDTAYTNRITSLTTTGSSGAATLAANVLNIPNYTLSGLGGVPTTRTLTINGTAFDLSANRSWSVGTVTSVAALTIGTTGTDISSTVANGTTTPVITLNIPTASATNRGALSAADWTTFNNKSNLTLGETSTTAYRGDRGKIAYDYSQIGHLPLAGGTLTGNVNWGQTDRGITWGFNTDGASIKFYNTGDGDTNSRLEFATTDNNNEYFRWVHIPTGGALYESMKLVPNSNGNAQLIVNGSIVKSGGTSTQYLMADGSTSTLTNPITGSGTTNYLLKFTGASTIGNSQIFDNGTRVGINTASISNTTLTIYDGTGNGDILKVDTNSTKADIWLNNSTTTNGAVRIRGESNGLKLITGSQERVFVDSSGNVGIGVANPTFNVDIGSAAQTVLRIRSGNVTNGGGALYISRAGTPGSTLCAFGDSSSIIGGTPNQSASIWSNNVPIIFIINTERMRITSGGNVLIGTTSDSGQKLQVNGDVKILDDITVGNTSLNYFDFDVSTGVFGIYSQAQYIHKYRGGASGALNMGQYDVNGNASINNTSNAALIFGTNNTARLTITSGGNIEIANQIYNPVNGKGNSGTGTVTFNWNDSNIQTVTLTGNCTFAFSNPQSGASYQIIITQDGTGGRTITWPAGIYWEGKTIPTLTGTANSRDIVTITYDGSNYNALIARNFGT